MKRNFIPSHKHDLDACEVLRNTDFEVVKPFAMEVLEWIQDLNWPVAEPVAAYLSPHAAELSEELVEILESNDQVWKYWLISAVLDSDDLGKYPAPLLRSLERIAYTPSYKEWEEEVDEMAQRLLETSDIDPEICSLIHFELCWQDTATDADKQDFLEMLQTNLADLESIGKVVIKGSKGKLKITDKSYSLRKSRGKLIKAVEQVNAELPHILQLLKSRYDE